MRAEGHPALHAQDGGHLDAGGRSADTFRLPRPYSPRTHVGALKLEEDSPRSRSPAPVFEVTPRPLARRVALFRFLAR